MHMYLLEKWKIKSSGFRVQTYVHSTTERTTKFPVVTDSEKKSYRLVYENWQFVFYELSRKLILEIEHFQLHPAMAFNRHFNFV